MKRFLIILPTAIVAIVLAIYTRPRPSTSDTSEADTATVVTESGKAIMKTPESQITERKKFYSELVASANEWSDEKWLKSFELTERSGKKVSSKDLNGKPYVASFFFSKCPSVCVQQNDRVKLLQSKFRNSDLRLVSISCDPENDTPEVLTEYAKRFGADPDLWLFLTGEWEYIKRVSAEVFFNALHTPKFHIEKFLLMDRQGKIVGDYDWHDAEELKILERDIQRLLDESPK
jgi:protein SCO1